MYADTVLKDLPVLFGCCVNCDPSFFLQVIDALTRKNQINGFFQIIFVSWNATPEGPDSISVWAAFKPKPRLPGSKECDKCASWEALDEDRQSTITLSSSSSPTTNAFCLTRNCPMAKPIFKSKPTQYRSKTSKSCLAAL